MLLKPPISGKSSLLEDKSVASCQDLLQVCEHVIVTSYSKPKDNQFDNQLAKKKLSNIEIIKQCEHALSDIGMSITRLHSKKRTTMKTRLNNVVLPSLFNVVNNTEQVVEFELACNEV